MPKGPFGIRELAEEAKRRGAVDLAQGVIHTAPPAVLGKALRELDYDVVSIYNNKRGVLEYREAVREYLGGRGWEVALEQVLGTAGAMGATVAALLADVPVQGKVLLPEPFFIGHKLILESLGYEIVYWPTGIGEDVDWEALMEQMAEVDALLLTTPANPTGVVVPAEVAREISLRAKEVDCLMIFDEIYREFVWSEEERSDAARADIDLAQAVIVRSFSKTFAIPGWRAGFSVTSEERSEVMALKHDSLYIGSSTIAQHALAVALEDGAPELEQYLADLRAMLRENLEQLSSAFEAYGMTPLPVPATYYLLLKHNGESDMKVMEELLEKNVVVTPVSILFSEQSKERGTDYIRAHFAAQPADVERAVAVLT